MAQSRACYNWSLLGVALLKLLTALKKMPQELFLQKQFINFNTIMLSIWQNSIFK